MPISWGSKDPDEVRNYTYSWLGPLAGSEIATATLEVKRGSIVLTNVSNTINSVSVTVSGGKHHEHALILSTVVTDGPEPQTLQEYITIRIAPSWAVGPSTATKRTIVSMAYEECSLSGYEFDVSPEELFSGLRSLDAIMAEDAAQSIDLGYNTPETFGGGDLEDYSGIPDAAVSYAALKLAKALCSKMGKNLSPDASARLAESKAVIRAITTRPATAHYHYGTPRGAGNTNFGWWPSPFLGARPRRR